jgi:phenylalanyl-tRNA synthetase alpha chain
MLEKLKDVTLRFEEALKNVNDLNDLEALRVTFCGKKGELTELSRSMGSLTPEERPVMGQKVNELRNLIENGLATKKDELNSKKRAEQLKNEVVDVTIPAEPVTRGTLHPLSLTQERMCEIFRSMGFDIVDGPEVETDYYNFQALNLPEDHPARDMQDTFYIAKNILLRTQTSAAQIRTMKSRNVPIRVICPGRVFRADEVDATHSPVFHQLEGLVVDKGINLCHLKYVLEEFAREMYGPDVKIKFRPSYFPFTEPSVEVDLTCSECGGKGCRVCKGTGWIEILGAGIVHPNVLRECGIDPDVYSGFAFGIGIDRITTTSNKIPDLRLVYENDIRFLKQFK